MIHLSLSITLPTPWNGEIFNVKEIGAVNFLVGPNGTGKSQFAHALLSKLRQRGDSARLLSTDRLHGMEQSRSFDRFVGDHFNRGYRKDEFDYYRTAGLEGAGIDTVLLLEERIDLRIQVEATLSQIFDREILLEWDSGNLMPRIRRRDNNNVYRMDREECHGIKELLILLTHLYNTDYKYLIVDEPELNLHPQYQAFFVDEVRKSAGDPTIDTRKKIVFLITHSPHIVDIRSEDDLKSVITFTTDYGTPRQMTNNISMNASSSQFLSRLNAHHKQFFFSDNPVFVEGIRDAQIVTAIMESHGKSLSAAGSCVIDCGGSEEVNHYVTLCNAIGKRAHFIYDIDSLFSGNLRSCIKDDKTIQSFLLSTGLGNDVAKYCGAMDRELTTIIDRLIANDVTDSLRSLKDYLCHLGVRKSWDKGKYAKARTALMIAISLFKADLLSVAKQTVENIEGRLGQILTALKEKNIHVLGGGTIERYLPSYSGDYYDPKEVDKQRAVTAEIGILSAGMTHAQLSVRYGDLYRAISKLPAKGEVDVVPVLRDYLGDYIHEFQKTVRKNPCWTANAIENRVMAILPSASKVFSIRTYESSGDGRFCATVEIVEMMGHSRRAARFGDRTNAGMGEFDISDADLLP